MQSFGFYNSNNKNWIDDDFNSVLDALVKTPGVSQVTHLLPSVGSGLSVDIAAGILIAQTQGTSLSTIKRWYRNTATENVLLDTAHATLPRYDIVCVKFDALNNTAILVSSATDSNCKGAANASPVVPATPTNYYKICEVYVAAAATTLSAGNVTDTRSLAVMAGDLDTLIKNRTISTGTKVDSNADENITLYGLARQAIINGNFDIWQRGTSMTMTSAAGYVADRWFSDNAGTAACTISRQDGTGIPGAQFCIRIQKNNGASGALTRTLDYTLPTADAIKFRGKKVTFSFWARAGANFSGASNQITYYVATGTGTDQKANAFTGNVNIENSTFTLTTSWQKFTITTSAAIANTANELALRLFVVFGTGTAGAADYVEFGQVQACQGTVALPFQPKGVHDEYEDCKFYYERIGYRWDGTPETDAIFGNGFMNTTTMARTFIPHGRKRRVPTFSISTASWFRALNAGGALTISGASVAGSATNGTIVDFTTSTGTLREGIIVQRADGQSPFINVDAEL